MRAHESVPRLPAVRPRRSGLRGLRATLIVERLGLRGRVVGARTAFAYWLTATTREFVAVLWFDRWMSVVLSALLLFPAMALLLPWGR